VVLQDLVVSNEGRKKRRLLVPIQLRLLLISSIQRSIT
jgi:hypothetical protein